MNTILTITTPAFAHWVEAQEPLCDEGERRVIRYDDDEQRGGSFGQPSFNLICWDKALAGAECLERMEDGELLFLLDADVLLFSPVSDIFKLARLRMDKSRTNICAQLDPDTGACMGFAVFRRCAETLALVRKWCAMRSDKWNDQVAMSQIIGRQWTPFLPSEVGSYGNLAAFPSVWRGQSFSFPRNLMAFHCNYVIGHADKERLAKLVREALA